MPIEITCTNCQAILRVADEHAGKSARCPQCSTVVPIPRSSSGPTDSAGIEKTASWSGDQHQPTPQQKQNPYAAPTAHQSFRHLANHRGTAILIMGITSIVCCPLLGIVAIVMGNEDLRKMDQGIMDPSGRGMTQAGKIIGIVSLVLAALSILFNVFFVGLAALAG